MPGRHLNAPSGDQRSPTSTQVPDTIVEIGFDLDLLRREGSVAQPASDQQRVARVYDLRMVIA